MPYIPSEKTDGKSLDRKLIDVKVEVVAKNITNRTGENFEVLTAYKSVFKEVGDNLKALQNGAIGVPSDAVGQLSETIFNVAKDYHYDGAFLGELNYAMTRLIQRVPQLKVNFGLWHVQSELRYWLYAVTTEALLWAADRFKDSGVGIGGVFIDIKDEYKRRVNVGYEAAQIIKSGDCYDTPYYTRLIEVVKSNGQHVGYQEIMLKRSEDTLHKDVLDGVSRIVSLQDLLHEAARS